MNHPRLLSGILFALAAGLMWGLVFVGPLLLPEYPATLQSFGRYLAFGLIALPLAWLDRAKLRQLSKADWTEALKLALVGNIVYYLFLASAIQRAGGPLPTMIIGTLPVVIAITSKLRRAPHIRQRESRLPWLRMLPSLLLIAAGIGFVNRAELQWLLRVDHNGNLDDGTDLTIYAVGALMAVGAVACWTWYPIRNAEWLRAHPDRSPGTWATAQGLATLPLAAAGFMLFWLWSAATDAAWPMPFGPRAWAYIGLMLAMGLFASWLGTLCWNEASQRLPPALSGQLIVFETLAALGYAFLLRGAWPAPGAWLGIGSLMAGVAVALRSR
ncbi:MAG: DMT family transporter [Rubrivivax sp.]